MTNNTHLTQISKRRWDRLLLPVVIVSAVCATLLGTRIGYWGALTMPAFTFGLWFCLRYTTPRTGMEAVSINGNPKVIALLVWLALIFSMVAIWTLVDTLVLGNSFYAPLTQFQIIAFVALIGVLLAGVHAIERHYAFESNEHKGSG